MPFYITCGYLLGAVWHYLRGLGITSSIERLLYARRVSEELVKKTIGLDELPRKGRKVPELNLDAVRELSLYSYQILYEIKSDKLIEVLAVIHKRQHLEAEDIPRDQ